MLNAETKPEIKFQNNRNLFLVSIKSRSLPLDYAIQGVFDYKTNATSRPNIGLLKTAIEE